MPNTECCYFNFSVCSFAFWSFRCRWILLFKYQYFFYPFYYLCNVIDPNTYTPSPIATTINQPIDWMIDRSGEDDDVSTSFKLECFSFFGLGLFFRVSYGLFWCRCVLWIDKPISSLCSCKFMPILNNCRDGDQMRKY